MGKYIFLLLCGIAFVVIMFFGSRLLCIYVRKPLVEYCNKRGLSASPWLTLIPVAIGVCMLDEYRMNIGHSWSELWQNAPDEQLPLAVFLFGGIGLIALPMIILLIRAKKNFLRVLLIKILCVPLDIFYVIHYCLKRNNFADGTPISREAYRNGGGYYQSDSQQGGYVDGEDTYSQGSIEEKYQDQYRASQTDDSYHTTVTEQGEHYYTGDYVPFTSEGEVTEVRTYDSDYAPMD